MQTRLFLFHSPLDLKTSSAATKKKKQTLHQDRIRHHEPVKHNAVHMGP